MYKIDTATERRTLKTAADDDYDISQELEYWTINDFEDVLPLHQPMAANDH